MATRTEQTQAMSPCHCRSSWRRRRRRTWPSTPQHVTTGSGRLVVPTGTATSGTYRRTADFRVSTTDPDATPMRRQDGHTHLGYQDHYVVDGGRARIILAALVAPAEVQENQPALDLLWRTRFRWKLRPRQVTGDTKYGTVENIVAIEAAAASGPTSPCRRSASGQGCSATQDFVYDAAADVYRCPGGAVLRFLSHSEATHRRIYQAPAAACAACALRAQCTTSQRGRRISRSLDEAYLDRVRGYHTTEPYAKAMRKRQVWVEPLFAEAKDWHGLRRFRLRGLEKVNGEAAADRGWPESEAAAQVGVAGDDDRSLMEPPGSCSPPVCPCQPCRHDNSATACPDQTTRERSASFPFSTPWISCEVQN